MFPYGHCSWHDVGMVKSEGPMPALLAPNLAQESVRLTPLPKSYRFHKFIINNSTIPSFLAGSFFIQIFLLQGSFKTKSHLPFLTSSSVSPSSGLSFGPFLFIIVRTFNAWYNFYLYLLVNHFLTHLPVLYSHFLYAQLKNFSQLCSREGD